MRNTQLCSASFAILYANNMGQPYELGIFCKTDVGTAKGSARFEE